MTAPRLLPFGDRGLLIEVDTLDEVLALAEALRATRPDGVVDLVPAARTVLVHVDPRRLSLAAARAWIAQTGDAPHVTRPPGAVVEVPIVYDGPDLEDLADSLGVTPHALATQHAACEWTVAFTGFAPGFAYLVSPDWPHDIPRRASPRTRVPAGAVGLAGAFAGAYPRETPGGWQLIGTTSAPLFDPDASPPALLVPGARVRFVPAAVASAPAAAAPTAAAPEPPPSVTSGPAAAAPASPSRPVPIPRPTPALTILEPGLGATLQDLGRPGHASEGIAASGAADRAALQTANRLIGNAPDAAGIEITMGGLRAVASTDLWLAVAGGWGDLSVDGRRVDPYTAFRVPAGAQVHVDWLTHGARAVLAVRGGLDGPRVAGSLATDTMSGLGPAPLRASDTVALAAAAPTGPIPPDDLHPWSPPAQGDLAVDLAPGPRADWVEDADALYDRVWTVSNAADRVGIRLEGVPLARSRTGELASEGMLPGAIQLPPDGLPVILGPDGPVTGGYPVIAVVTDASRDLLAQARPGTRIRFRHAR